MVNGRHARGDVDAVRHGGCWLGCSRHGWGRCLTVNGAALGGVNDGIYGWPERKITLGSSLGVG